MITFSKTKAMNSGNWGFIIVRVFISSSKLAPSSPTLFSVFLNADSVNASGLSYQFIFTTEYLHE